MHSTLGFPDNKKSSENYEAENKYKPYISEVDEVDDNASVGLLYF